MSKPTTSLFEVFTRVFWMMLGPVILVFLAANIATSGKGWLSNQSIVFLVLVAGLIVARWSEFRRGNPLTSTGEPATQEHLRSYIMGTVCLGVLAWLVANVAGNHFLSH